MIAEFAKAFFYTFVGSTILFFVGLFSYAAYEIAALIGNPKDVFISFTLFAFFLVFSYWVGVGIFGPPDDYDSHGV